MVLIFITFLGVILSSIFFHQWRRSVLTAYSPIFLVAGVALNISALALSIILQRTLLTGVVIGVLLAGCVIYTLDRRL